MDSFSWSQAPNAESVSEAVLDRIATLTTHWEAKARSPGIGRKQIKEALDGLFQSEERLGKELPSPQDADYWASVVGELITRLDAKLNPPPTPKPQQPPLAAVAPAHTIIPLGQRWQIQCAMGQGVVANLGRFTLHSDKFFSCSPVVMFNAQTRQAGLLHYASGNRSQGSQLKAMHDRINPTNVVLNWRVDPLHMESRQENWTDVDFLMDFLRILETEATIDVLDLQSGAYYVFLDSGGALRVDADKPPSAGSFDATNIVTAGPLNTEVDLHFSPEAYSANFATGVY